MLSLQLTTSALLLSVSFVLTFSQGLATLPMSTVICGFPRVPGGRWRRQAHSSSGAVGVQNRALIQKGAGAWSKSWLLSQASPEAVFLKLKRAFPNQLPQYAIKLMTASNSRNPFHPELSKQQGIPQTDKGLIFLLSMICDFAFCIYGGSLHVFLAGEIKTFFIAQWFSTCGV